MSTNSLHTAILVFTLIGSLTACSNKQATVYRTSAAGEKCAQVENITFHKGTIDNAYIINTADRRQQIDGFGVSLTESSAFVLACLPEEQRNAILQEFFSEQGANFSVTRTMIGASDFSVEGLYSLAEEPDDTLLTSFSMAHDMEGFSKEQYPSIQDEHYDLYHLMKDVAAIKAQQTDPTYRILASPWTAPAWMKDNGMYYQRDNTARRGGKLLPQYYPTFAKYIVKYMQFWQNEGINFWTITPENEPMGNDGGWESMEMSPAEEALFIGQYLGPELQAKGFTDVNIFGFDQNIFEMGPYTAAIYGDSLSNTYTNGMAIHWYGSTISCFPEVLDSIHALYPDKILFHTEGCVDNLGCPDWSGVSDPVGFTESGWFNNDSFWWTPSATDWAYSTPFWPELHPAYAVTHRYASYIIDGLNHWMSGLCDWNMALDSIGGPTHVQNRCGAPVMVDYKNDIVYYTPYYYILKQFSRTMRPGDTVLGTTTDTPNDNIHICAVQKQDGQTAIQILNTANEPQDVRLQIGDNYADFQMPANAVQTIIVKL